MKERAKKNPVEIKGFWLLSEAETEPFIKVNSVLNKSQKNDDNSRKNKDNSREQSLKESKVKKSKGNNNTVTFVPDERVNRAICDFIEYRKKTGKAMTDRAIELMIGSLNKLSSDPADQVEILNQSIMNGWQGVFPLKERKTPAQSGRKPNQFHNFEQRDTDYDSMVQADVLGWIGEEKDGGE
ncbi:MAG: hypothetical protein PHV18_15420 [Lachnospiraceae bacterium]|nr:hypothetical protein [Lachnospiraceae bacterium]